MRSIRTRSHRTTGPDTTRRWRFRSRVRASPLGRSARRRQLPHSFVAVAVAAGVEIHHTAGVVHHTAGVVHHTAEVVHHTAEVVQHTLGLVHHTAVVVHMVEVPAELRTKDGELIKCEWVVMNRISRSPYSTYIMYRPNRSASTLTSKKLHSRYDGLHSRHDGLHYSRHDGLHSRHGGLRM